MTSMSFNQSMPESLQDLCIFYCVNNLECLTTRRDDEASSVFSLLLGNKLLDYYLRTAVPNEDSDTLLNHLVQNSQLCNSLQLNRKGILSLENILELANNALKHLDITVFTGSVELQTGLEIMIENNVKNLISLKLQNKSDDSDDCLGLLESLCKVKQDCDDLDGCGGDNAKASPANHRFINRKLGEMDKPARALDQNLTALKSLSYIRTSCSSTLNLFGSFLESKLDKLLVKALEHNRGLKAVSFISAVSHPCISYLPERALYNLNNLTYLVLSSDAAQPPSIPECMFVNLPKLQNLQHLDLSYGVELTSNSPTQGILKFSDADIRVFKQAVIEMPHLNSLDISGTNLTEIVCHSEHDQECSKHCMPGFEDRRFHFLGLYFSDTCTHEYIPAHKISGTNSEEQLLVALWSHHHNKTIMYFVLKEIQLHINAMQSKLQKPAAMFEGLVFYLEQMGDWDLTSSGFSITELRNIENVFVNIYYLIRFKALQKDLALQWKRRLLDCVISVCNSCARDLLRVFGIGRETLMQVARVALLIVMVLGLEDATIYSYSFERYMRVLIRLMTCNMGPQRQMIVLRLVHSGCRLNQDLKVVVGQKLKLVETLLGEINNLLSIENGNIDILGKMWSILWTLTDEVPINCELFVEKGGCETALKSCNVIDEDDDLARKVSGAMCNVSEVEHLRPRLMTEPLVKLFRKLLDLYRPNNYDITSHAAAYLVLLVADGPEAWTLEEPSRDAIIQDIDEVIRDHWDLNTPKGVKFRSLTPMMWQLENFSTPTAQYWAAWMICNLTIVKPDRYCAMVISENGLEIIQRALQHGGLRADVLELMIKIQTKTLEFQNGDFVAGYGSD